MNEPRFKTLEIEINSTCDKNCPHCDRFIDVAPAPPMTLAQVEHFVDESLALDWQWDRIHILGGEPTLHAELSEIIDALCRYRRRFPDVLLRLISNGAGKLTAVRPMLDKHDITVNVEAKSGKLPNWFTNMLRAPVDVLGSPEPIPPCGIFGISGCGIGLTKHGYFLCGCGASIARVCGLDVGVMRLQDLTYDAMLRQAEKICNVCGHHNRTSVIAQDDGEASPFWKNALEQYRQTVPPMSIYGPVS